MSTRAHIAFFDAEPEAEQVTKPDVLIYKHSDGYPEGTLPQLTEFCRLFNEKRGLRDNEYATARCVQFMTNFNDAETEKWRKEVKMEKEFSFLGYGVGTNFHGDIEFYYVVTPEEIKVFEVNYDYENEDSKVKLSLVDTVPLKEKAV